MHVCVYMCVCMYVCVYIIDYTYNQFMIITCQIGIYYYYIRYALYYG